MVVLNRKIANFISTVKAQFPHTALFRHSLENQFTFGIDISAIVGRIAHF
jgi:hypothetical protein